MVQGGASRLVCSSLSSGNRLKEASVDTDFGLPLHIKWYINNINDETLYKYKDKHFLTIVRDQYNFTLGVKLCSLVLVRKLNAGG